MFEGVQFNTEHMWFVFKWNHSNNCEHAFKAAASFRISYIDTFVVKGMSIYSHIYISECLILAKKYEDTKCFGVNWNIKKFM